jgi:DNA replication protein DnaC
VLTETLAPPTQSELVNTLEWAKFLEFDLNSGDDRDSLEAMVNASARFIRAIKAKKKPYWLSLLGTSGAGKTFLAKKIWRWYKRSIFFQSKVHEDTGEIEYPGQFCFWPNMAGNLLGNQGYGLLDDLGQDRLVVFDEIGADRDPSGHVRDCLARVLSKRVGKWTIITSNKSLEQIQTDIDTRVASRMVRDGSEVVDVEVTDYALRK